MPKGEHNRKLLETNIARAITMYTAPLPDGTWMSANKIAAEFRVSHTALRRQLRTHGITIRSMSETQAGKQYKPRKKHAEPPLCKCGCGQPVTSYDRGRKRWRCYLPKHYYPTSDNPPGPRRNGFLQTRISRATKERDSYTCQRCAAQTNLHAHHIDGGKTNNAPGNLITLCAACHHAVHAEPLR